MDQIEKKQIEYLKKRKEALISGFIDACEEINNLKYKVCCPLCDNVKCVRGTDKCEAEIWARQKQQKEN